MQKLRISSATVHGNGTEKWNYKKKNNLIVREETIQYTKNIKQKREGNGW